MELVNGLRYVILAHFFIGIKCFQVLCYQNFSIIISKIKNRELITLHLPKQTVNDQEMK